jgi:hypothetical protein
MLSGWFASTCRNTAWLACSAQFRILMSANVNQIYIVRFKYKFPVNCCRRQHTIPDMKYCVPAFTCAQSLWPSYVQSIEISICVFSVCLLPWFQRFKINLWLKAAIDSSSRANQFELGSDPDSVS